MTNNYEKNKYGYVFNIQKYSVHDGPGIRTIVFLKGCPLKCRWCSNPESQQLLPELAFNNNKCIGINECMHCMEVCFTGAIKKDEENKLFIDREICDNCLYCADVCPSKALTVFGKLKSVEKVLDEVESDSIFYSRSGGGLTISGGEPLMQADFTAELLKEAKRRRMKTTIETCGYADWCDLKKVSEYLSTIIYDLKCIDSNKHKEFTAVSNKRILENFNKLCENFTDLPILVRTPVIPGFNDSKEDILAIIDFIKGKANVKYELLAYHRLGQPKYEFLGREYPLGNIKLDDKKMKDLKEIVKARL